MVMVMILELFVNYYLYHIENNSYSSLMVMNNRNLYKDFDYVEYIISIDNPYKKNH
jgi:hypothetical protein